MRYSDVSILAIAVCTFYGVVAFIFPAQVCFLYGIEVEGKGTLFLVQLLGIDFLFLTAYFAAMKGCKEPVLQARFSRYTSIVNGMAAVFVAYSALTGVGNSLLWTSVLTYLFFMGAYGSIGFKEETTESPSRFRQSSAAPDNH